MSDFPTGPAPEYLRRKDAAKFIGMSVAYLRGCERLGKGPERVRCGKIPLYTLEGLRRFMAARIER